MAQSEKIKGISQKSSCLSGVSNQMTLQRLTLTRTDFMGGFSEDRQQLDKGGRLGIKESWTGYRTQQDFRGADGCEVRRGEKPLLAVNHSETSKSTCTQNCVINSHLYFPK